MKIIPPEELEKARQEREEALAKARGAKGGPDPAGDLKAKLSGRYGYHEGMTVINKVGADGEIIPTPLATFTARIATQITVDDGQSPTQLWELRGNRQDGSELPPIEVRANKFASLEWVSHWGCEAVVLAGAAARDHLRAAIQLLSTNIQRRHVYAHTGWRKLGNGWSYLHAAGAMGEAGNDPAKEVRLADSMDEYHLPDAVLPPPTLIASTLRFLDVAPLEISAPLFLGIYRAALGEACPVNFSLFLQGSTGKRKTEVAALVQAHYGPTFTGIHLPGSWESTSNALEGKAFRLKDAVFVVDDFAPRGAKTDIARMHAKADRLLRSQANGNGRDRLSGDCGFRDTYRPRGLIIATGEDIPTGGSLRGRMLILEFSSDSVDLEVLTELQGSAARGELAQALTLFIQWLAPRMDELKAILPSRQRELRGKALQIDAHSRTPDIIASLFLAAEVFNDFAEAHGFLLGTEWLEEIWRALIAAGEEQTQFQTSEDHAKRFIGLINAALSSGRAHVARLDDQQPGFTEPMSPLGWQLRSYGVGDHERTDWYPQGECIGRFEAEDLYLDPVASYACAQKLASIMGEPIPVQPRTLFKTLDEKWYLLTRDTTRNNRFTVRKYVGGKTRRYFLHFSLKTIGGYM